MTDTASRQQRVGLHLPLDVGGRDAGGAPFAETTRTPERQRRRRCPSRAGRTCRWAPGWTCASSSRPPCATTSAARRSYARAGGGLPGGALPGRGRSPASACVSWARSRKPPGPHGGHAIAVIYSVAFAPGFRSGMARAEAAGQDRRRHGRRARPRARASRWPWPRKAPTSRSRIARAGAGAAGGRGRAALAAGRRAALGPADARRAGRDRPLRGRGGRARWAASTCW